MSDKMNFADAAIIAQAMKERMRSGAFWTDLTPAARESLDQIVTLIGRTVSGDGAHWDSIVGYAQAARPTTNELNPLRPQIEGRPRAAIAGVEAIERSIRDIPTRNGNG